MEGMEGLNAHERAPEVIRQRYKKYQKLSLSEIDSHPDIIDCQRVGVDGLPEGGLLQEGTLRAATLRTAFADFMSGEGCGSSQPQDLSLQDVPIFAHPAVPGLKIIPSLLPPAVQLELISRLFNRDLSNERHQTNVHLHYNVSYPSHKQAVDAETTNSSPSTDSSERSNSFFNDDSARVFLPKDPDVHKPISVQHFLDRKLRWMTLGGQYNWTDKKYPSETPPQFPKDIATLLRQIFPDTDAQAAIVNLYSPGDTLSVHRDVSEECDTGLISISFGCDGLFMIGSDNSDSSEVIRLRSGDAVYMTGRSRFAWHGVPKIIPATCPSWLKDRPSPTAANADERNLWKGWMSGKRINLNVRQMKHN